MYVNKHPYELFKKLAEQAPPGTTDEQLYSGLTNLARDIEELLTLTKDARNHAQRAASR